VKKVIELLERAEGCIMLAHAEASPADREELNRAIDCIRDAIVEIEKEDVSEKGD
jgi:DNA-binding XRE family transcriptional regulator